MVKFLIMGFWDGELNSAASRMGVRISASSAEIGCAAWVVVLRAGANALSERASRFKGQIPIHAKAEIMVVNLNATSRAS